MKKNLFSMLFLPLCFVAFLLTFTSCTGEEETTTLPDNAPETTSRQEESSDLPSNLPPEHAHTYNYGWSKDDTHHWHSATCEHTEVKADYAAHAFGEGNVQRKPTCTTPGRIVYSCVCGAKRTEEISITDHAFSAEWATNDTHHWHPAACACGTAREAEARHTFDADGRCTVCRHRQPTVGVVYELSADGRSYIVGNNQETEPAEIVIASHYNGLPVTAIGEQAFFQCQNLRSVTIPEGIIEIRDGAFYGCKSLSELHIPGSVTKIDRQAFIFMSGLEKITAAPNNPMYHADGNCLIATDMKNVILGCTGAVIPADGSVISIDSDAFAYTGITSIHIPASVIKIAAFAFNSCSDVLSITVEEGNPIYHAEGNCLIETYSKTLLYGCRNSIIPTDGSVTSIGTVAFQNQAYLTQIVIPDTVTSIASSAFSSTGLVELVLPDSIERIDDLAFSYCANLKKVTLPQKQPMLGDLSFSACIALETLVIPDGWNEIPTHMLYACTSLKALVIPASVKTIAEAALDMTHKDLILFYKGSAEEWGGVTIEPHTDYNSSAPNVFFYSETEPDGEGSKAWHFDADGIPVVW